MLAGIVFRHPSPESLLRELARNPSLMAVCGFDPLPIQRKPEPRVVTDPDTGLSRIERPPAPEPVRAVPASGNFSRFPTNVIELEERLGMLSERVAILRERLMAVLPDFGRHLGFDGTDIASHSTGQTHRTTGRTSDPDADRATTKPGGAMPTPGKPGKRSTCSGAADTRDRLAVSRFKQAAVDRDKAPRGGARLPFASDKNYSHLNCSSRTLAHSDARWRRCPGCRRAQQRSPDGRKNGTGQRSLDFVLKSIQYEL